MAAYIIAFSVFTLMIGYYIIIKKLLSAYSADADKTLHKSTNLEPSPKVVPSAPSHTTSDPNLATFGVSPLQLTILETLITLIQMMIIFIITTIRTETNQPLFLIRAK